MLWFNTRYIEWRLYLDVSGFWICGHADKPLKINGMRPKIISGIPTEYKKLMKRCWMSTIKKSDKVTLFDYFIQIIFNREYWSNKYNK
ncbi:hypothetical protein C1645_829153 [Glomus cerebriforme]|uniref:Serine-threonine/tyrosine-protein kinase catalytic domain-containing protein n=1 Tax=Glomus cerebriforme TaxID=658196 RepID=A0A397SPG9_9GLOM|nr:hypothetical protein C1645_829153 [Glomus cerebriforme]